jgi:hypothetical protein
MPIIKDPRIQLSSEQGKQVAQLICKEIKDSLEKNKKIYDRAKRCENQTNQITKWMEQGKTCEVPWKGAADYFVPLTEWIVDAIFARLMSILFSQEPYMKAKGADAASMATQDDATDFVDMIFRKKVHLYENANFFFKQMLKLPIAVLKYCWIQDYDAQIKKETALAFASPQDGSLQYITKDDPEGMLKMAQFTANGYIPQGEQEVWTYNEVEIYDAPKAQYINLQDYVWTPGTKRNTKPFWEGDRAWFTLNDMKLKVMQDKFIAESVERIRSKTLSGLTGLDSVLKERESPVECFHWFGRLPFNMRNELDLYDKEAIEQEVYCLVAYKDEELLQIMSWPYNRYPIEDRVYIRGAYEETTEFEGRSMVEKLYKTQQELNDFRNTLMNNAWIAMQKIFVKQRSLQGDQYEKPKVYPGAMWEEDVPGSIRVLSTGDVANIAIELEQELLAFAERISNIQNWNLGVRAEGGKPTATEFAGTIQEGNIGREPLLQRCYKILSKICEWTIDYYKDRIPFGMERQIKDSNGNVISPTAENMGVYSQFKKSPQWSNENISGNYDWIWQGTSLNSDKQWNLMVDKDLLEMSATQPLIGQNLLAVWTILKKNLIDRGIKNWEEILPPKDAIIKEMQMKAQNAQMQQAQNGLRKRIVNKLIEKGVAPDKAEALVQQKMGEIGNVRQPV